MREKKMKKVFMLVVALLVTMFCLTGCAEEKKIGDNLVAGSTSEWSEWITPEVNEENWTYNVLTAFLGDRQVGDEYTCSLEIEFQGVTGGEGFGFNTQGAVDKSWKLGNVWNSKIVKLTEAPIDDVYYYTATNKITEKNVNAVSFNIGFRCDYWSAGSFRVRNIKVEKGPEATEWVQSIYDVGDGVNLAAGTSSEWSEWLTPEVDKNNNTFNPFYAILGEKRIGDAYTCSLEIEFKDVRATSTENEEQKFRFITQGAVDKSWEHGNVWNSSLIKLTEAISDGVYNYVSTVRITEKNVKAEQFNLGFRCDYWGSGSFRVRNVKVEKGITATEWTPAE